MGEVGVRVRGERDREFHGLFIYLFYNQIQFKRLGCSVLV